MQDLRKLINKFRAAIQSAAVQSVQALTQWLTLDGRNQLPRNESSLPDGTRLQPIPIERHNPKHRAGTSPFRTRTHKFN